MVYVTADDTSKGTERLVQKGCYALYEAVSELGLKDKSLMHGTTTVYLLKETESLESKVMCSGLLPSLKILTTLLSYTHTRSGARELSNMTYLPLPIPL